MNGPMAASWADVELGWQRERIVRMTAVPGRHRPPWSRLVRRRPKRTPRTVPDPRAVGALAR